MDGIYRRIQVRNRPEGPRAAVFLDRDGVVIEDSGYLARVEDIRYIPGSMEAIAGLNRSGIPVVLVTNQSGVGRGYYTWRDFENVQSALERELGKYEAWFDGVWACAYHESGIGAYGVKDHPYRKPNPGMILDAAREINLTVENSWMIGDRTDDMSAGWRAGVRNLVQIGPDADGLPIAVAGWDLHATGPEPRLFRRADLASAVALVTASGDMQRAGEAVG